jgi:hypothetical protein
MNYLLALIGPRVGLEKSPDTVFTDEAIDACVNAYPHARFLHLTRHPVTTQRSMHAAWERPALRGRELVVTAAAAWYLGHSRIIKTLARLRHEQWMRVRAEDVLTDPRGWLPRILEWLRLPADGPIIERMLRTEEWRFAGTGPDGDLYGGDPGFFRSPAIRAIADPGPVRFDPEWGLRETTCRRMAALAQYLGY